MKNLSKDNIVVYNNIKCKVIKVWNHGGDMVYYDLEDIELSLPDLLPDYRRVYNSVHHSEIKEIIK